MPTTIVLAVGMDSLLSATQLALWKSAGYILMSIDSIREAIRHFRTGDFDLVLLGPSVSLDHKETLTYLIRASGSRTPIVCIADSLGDHTSFADATLNYNSATLLEGLRELLVKTSGMRATGSIAYDIAS